MPFSLFCDTESIYILLSSEGSNWDITELKTNNIQIFFFYNITLILIFLFSYSSDFNDNIDTIDSGIHHRKRTTACRSVTIHLPNERQIVNDQRLDDWLCRQNIDTVVRNTILNEEFSYEDFVYHMEKDDLIRIGLK